MCVCVCFSPRKAEKDGFCLTASRPGCRSALLPVRPNHFLGVPWGTNMEPGGCKTVVGSGGLHVEGKNSTTISEGPPPCLWCTRGSGPLRFSKTVPTQTEGTPHPGVGPPSKKSLGIGCEPKHVLMSTNRPFPIRRHTTHLGLLEPYHHSLPQKKKTRQKERG